MQELINNQQDIIRRDKELREILHSITELQEIFGELSQLVIEQGTLLDRIDYNIDTTHELLVASNKNLESAESWQKCTCPTLCIMLLLFLIGGIALVLIIKFV